MAKIRKEQLNNAQKGLGKNLETIFQGCESISQATDIAVRIMEIVDIIKDKRIEEFDKVETSIEIELF